MSGVTTHVLDLAEGRPAAGVAVTLERRTDDGGWVAIGEGMTDDDGRLGDLLESDQALHAGVYRLTFATGSYFELRAVRRFHPQVTIHFEVADPQEHHHVPLLVSPFGYTTYRGS